MYPGAPARRGGDARPTADTPSPCRGRMRPDRRTGMTATPPRGRARGDPGAQCGCDTNARPDALGQSSHSPCAFIAATRLSKVALVAPIKPGDGGSVSGRGRGVRRADKCGGARIREAARRREFVMRQHPDAHARFLLAPACARLRSTSTTAVELGRSAFCSAVSPSPAAPARRGGSWRTP